MTFEEVNKKRRSVRDFLDKPVSEDLIQELLKEALEAPSSSNTQPFKVVVATGDTLQAIGEDLTNKYRKSLTLRKKNIFGKLITAYQYRLTPNKVYQTIQGKYPGIYQDRRVKTAIGLYEVLGIKKEDRKKRNEELEKNFYFFGAPAAIWIYADPKMKYTALVDTGIFMQNFMLACTAKGLGSCPQGALNLWREPVDKYYDVPKGYELVCGISFGYPSDAKVNSYRPEKLSVEELLVKKK
ncbi:MAG: nitrobenzoate reductase [Flavobacteriaceae bacterium]|nr:nitrobenzoate reductase [Flavobacteriaceae bacterium]|tara:strand:- start:23185 stop:23904 length:720 start_codon:yes stop_codon:yes gene_type:complete